MEDLIIAILQGIFEFTLEVLSYLPFDWPLTEKTPISLSGKCVLLFVAGCGFAGISVLILKHTWISFSVLRIANLILAPVTSAFISQAIARRRMKKNRSIIPRNHFWQAFWFTLGIALVRFTYAIRL